MRWKSATCVATGAIRCRAIGRSYEMCAVIENRTSSSTYNRRPNAACTSRHGCGTSPRNARADGTPRGVARAAPSAWSTASIAVKYSCASAVARSATHSGSSNPVSGLAELHLERARERDVDVGEGGAGVVVELELAAPTVQLRRDEGDLVGTRHLGRSPVRRRPPVARAQSTQLAGEPEPVRADAVARGPRAAQQGHVVGRRQPVGPDLRRVDEPTFEQPGHRTEPLEGLDRDAETVRVQGVPLAQQVEREAELDRRTVFSATPSSPTSGRGMTVESSRDRPVSACTTHIATTRSV